MQPSIVLNETPDGYVLRTTLGNPVGARMLTVAPQSGKSLPEVPSGPIESKLDAERLRLAWNTYLIHAHKSREKSRVRTAD